MSKVMPPVDPRLLDIPDSPVRSEDPAGAFRRLLNYLEELVFDRPLWHLIALVAIVDVLKNGISKVPEISDWAHMARSFPGRPNVGQADRFILSSPLGPAIAHGFGVTTSNGYAAFSFAATVVAVVVLIIGLHRVGGRVAAGVGVVALFASPLSNTLITWLGKEDPFLLLFTAAVVLLDNPLVVFIGAIGLAGSNPEAGGIVVLLALAIRATETPRRHAPIGAMILGLAGGIVLVSSYTTHIGAGMGGRFQFVRQTGGRELVREFLSEWSTWAFSVFGGYWFSIATLCGKVVTGRRRAVLGVSALLCLFVALVSVDQTRIAALVSMPLLLWFVATAARCVDSAVLRRSTAVSLLLAIVLPSVVVQGGSAYVSHLGAVLPSWM